MQSHPSDTEPFVKAKEEMLSRANLPAATRGAATRLAWLLALCCLLGTSTSMAAPDRNVLVLFSNNRLLPANIEVDQGLREATAAAAAGRNVEIFAEFLDSPAFSGQAYEQDTAFYLRRKYTAHPPHAIVVAGEPALEFLLRHRSDLFTDLPVVHVAINRNYLQARPPLPADVIGVPVVYDSLGTIRLALQWHPNARRLVLVTGASGLDREREAVLRAGIPELHLRQTVEYLSGLPTDALLRRLDQLTADDVVYTPGYFRDGAGQAFLPRQSVARMAAASGAPIYAPYETFLGAGIVGGRMPTFGDMGRQAGRTVNAVLDGVRPSAIALPERIPSPVQVDWRQARRWGVTAAVPPEAIVHFREPTFWEAYRTQAIVAAIVFLVQACLIAALLLERRRSRRATTALEESERRMSLAAHAARLSMWMWDLTHGRIWTTAKPRQHAGLSKETPESFDQILETIHPADREGFERAVRQAATAGSELDVEYRVLHADGEVRWFAARGHAVERGTQRLAGVKMDITARKEAELQAEKDRSALTHMTRVSMMGQLSASIAHQLTQPLAVIVGNAEVARAMLDREIDRAELQEICDDMIAAGMGAAEIVRRLSAFYKRGEMAFAPLDLNELVRETLDLVRIELTNRRVETVTELAPPLPLIEGGRVHLQQVLLNLIINAADAMGESDASERKLWIRTAFDAARVRLDVVDHGTGIAPGNIGSVFDAFWSTKASGTGVGLAICMSIVKAHRGTLSVLNNPDRGATFRVTFPIPQEPAMWTAQ